MKVNFRCFLGGFYVTHRVFKSLSVKMNTMDRFFSNPCFSSSLKSDEAVHDKSIRHSNKHGMAWLRMSESSHLSCRTPPLGHDGPLVVKELTVLWTWWLHVISRSRVEQITDMRARILPRSDSNIY